MIALKIHRKKNCLCLLEESLAKTKEHINLLRMNIKAAL